MYRIERGDTIQIFVDADACPVIHIVETIAEKHKSDANGVPHKQESQAKFT